MMRLLFGNWLSVYDASTLAKEPNQIIYLHDSRNPPGGSVNATIRVIMENDIL
ncbi:MAG: hypothetical protein PF630_03300 [Gammaproteobacteria bacterium]|jgi:hypothetical protein|nr:hypothetical protein [Gammaproteobacteria bacterium]